MGAYQSSNHEQNGAQEEEEAAMPPNVAMVLGFALARGCHPCGRCEGRGEVFDAAVGYADTKHCPECNGSGANLVTAELYMRRLERCAGDD